MADAKSKSGGWRTPAPVALARCTRERTIADASNSSGDFWQAVYGEGVRRGVRREGKRERERVCVCVRVRRQERRGDEVQRQRQRSLGEVSVGRSRVGPGPPVSTPSPHLPLALLHPLHACTYAHLRARSSRPLDDRESADRRPRSLSFTFTSTPISLRLSFFSHSWRQTRLLRISDSLVRTSYRMYRSVVSNARDQGIEYLTGFGSLVRRIPTELSSFSDGASCCMQRKQSQTSAAAQGDRVNDKREYLWKTIGNASFSLGNPQSAADGRFLARQRFL